MLHFSVEVKASLLLSRRGVTLPVSWCNLSRGWCVIGSHDDHYKGPKHVVVAKICIPAVANKLSCVLTIIYIYSTLQYTTEMSELKADKHIWDISVIQSMVLIIRLEIFLNSISNSHFLEAIFRTGFGFFPIEIYLFIFPLILICNMEPGATSF